MKFLSNLDKWIYTLLDLASFCLLQKYFFDPQVEHFDTFLRWIEI